VQGGARTIIDGLLAEDCTVLAPTFSWEFSVPPPHHLRPMRNGTNYDLGAMSARGVERVFSPESSEVDRAQMGAIPAAILAMEGHVRGNHPSTPSQRSGFLLIA
jgi:aminoglycoside N3'-acetyltransferase